MTDTPVSLLLPEVQKDLLHIFKLLADETRFRILLYLADRGELDVSTMCNILGHTQPAVSHHLSLLRLAGLIEMRRDGKHNFYSLFRSRFNGLVESIVRSRGEETQELRFGQFVLSYAN